MKRGRDRLSVVHFAPLPDPLKRGPEELLAAWFTLADIAVAVASQGVAVTVVQAAARDGTLDRDGVRYRFIRTPAVRAPHRRAGLWATPIPPALASVLRSVDPDVVHVHSLSFPRHVRRVAVALPRAPILVQDHADGPPSRWKRGMFRRGLASIHGASFSAREQAEPFFRSGLLPRDLPIFVIPETSSHFSPGDREEARAATGLHGDPCLVWVGHLDANKDPLTILEAARRAFPELPDPHLWMAFRAAPLGREVEEAARAEALAGRVHLLGPQPRDRVEGLLRAADFFVLGSHKEGSGVAFIEALACGATPLATDIPSFRELTGHGSVGALSPPGDAGAMAGNMVAWSGKDRRDLRASTRRHFDERVSFSVVGRDLVAAYEDLLAGGSKRPARAPTRRSGVSFGPYRPGEEEALTALFRVCFRRPATPEWWRWKLLGRQGRADTVLVGRDADGHPIFQMGGIPRAAFLAGREITVMVAVDGMTRPDHRRGGVLSEGCQRLFERWREQGVSLVLGLPNEQWGSRTVALGWRPLFPLQWRVRLLRPAAILARRWKLPFLARGRGAEALWNGVWDHRRAGDPGLDIEEAVPSEAELGAFGARIAPDTRLVRDAGWVRWRYLEAPHAAYRLLCARRGGRLEGWLAYAVRDEAARRVAFVAEMSASRGGIDGALVRALSRRLREEGVDLIATLAAPGTDRDRVLRGAGFFRAWGAFVVHGVALDPRISLDDAADARRWHLEAGDFDVV